MAQTDSAEISRLRSQIVTELELEAFPVYGYRHGAYLQRVIDAGFTASDLATAHDVTRKTVRRMANRHDIDLPHRPTSGLARRLWDLDADAVGGDA